MTTITTRAGKGSPLTNDEMDANLTGLNDDKVEASGDSITGNLSFGDNNKAIFGAGSDLQIFSEGSSGNSFINETGNGSLFINASNLYLRKGEATFENFVACTANGDVKLYYDNAEKLATTSTGIDVTGTVTADGLTVDGASDLNGNVTIGSSITTLLTGNDIEFQRAGDSYLSQTGGGALNIRTNDGVSNKVRMLLNSNGDISFYEDTGTTAKLFWDASAESLGIGTSPSYPLHVAGNQFNTGWIRANTGTAANPNFTIDGGAGMFKPTSNQVAFSTASTERMRIDSSGNVGIGTSSPSTTLDVEGNITLSGSNGKIYLPQTPNTFNWIGDEIEQTGIVIVPTNDGTSERITFAVDNAERMRISRSGNVGIGTSSPDYNFHVTGTGDTIAAVTAGASSVAGLNLGNSTNKADGGIRYDNSADALIFRASNAEKMRIDSSGHLLVGTTDTTLYNNTTGNGFMVFGSGGVHVAKESSGATDPALLLNNTGDDGQVIRIAKDGVTVGSIGTETSNSDLYIGNGDTAIMFHDGVDAIFPHNASTNASRDAAIDIGYSTYRFKDLYLSGNVNVTGGKISSYASDSSAPYFADAGNVGIRLSQAGVDDVVPCSSTGADRDNGINFGSAGARWGTIFAATGTINTSDQNEKQDIAELSDAEQRVAVAAKGLLRKFRWKSSVEEKGDDARIHFGIIAQDLQDAFTAEGLDASNYAMWCSDTWIDENTGEERTRMGVRYSELLAFIIAAI